MAKKNKKESVVELAYYKYFNNVQVGMMDIPKISKDIQKALELPTEQFDTEMKRLVEVWRHK